MSKNWEKEKKGNIKKYIKTLSKSSALSFNHFFFKQITKNLK